MKKNTAGQTINFAAIVRADGTDGGNVAATVDIAIDGIGPSPSNGVLEWVAAGVFEYTPTQAETNANHVVFVFKEATLITQVVNVYPIDVEEYKADVSGLSTFDHTADEVTTDAASRTASQADVSGLATQSSLDTVPKKGTAHRYTNTGSGAGYDDVTITDAP